jgi:(p)ppGpp synthase/HD superfamily hydrolase
MAQTIAERYGPHVRDIVLECSDSSDQTEAPWQARKEAYLRQIATKSTEAILVTSCDKLHNATSILHDLRTVGPAVFERFTADRDGTLLYNRSLVTAPRPRAPAPLAERLELTVSAVERLAAEAA